MFIDPKEKQIQMFVQISTPELTHNLIISKLNLERKKNIGIHELGDMA